MNRYLNVNRIEFAVTYLCNGKCKHCYTTMDKEMFPNHIDEFIAQEIVRKVGKKHHPRSIMTFGGEPLLFPEIVFKIHKEAMKVGILHREVITNGYSSNNDKKVEEIAKGLFNSGVNNVIISVDVFHQEHIPLKYVRKAAQSCLKAGIKDIEWNPCWVIAENENNRYNKKTKKILQSLEDLSIKISYGNVMEPDGFALLNLKEFLPKKEKIPIGKCGDIPYTDPLDSIQSIFIEPDGKIAVCNDFYIGNARKMDVLKIIEEYDPYKIIEMKSIIENGMIGLAEWARKKGIDPDPNGYYSICHMCTDIRKKVKNNNKDPVGVFRKKSS